MENTKREAKKDVICHCSGTTTTQIEGLFEEDLCSLEEISQWTGACSGCGACDVPIMELLAELNYCAGQKSA